MKILVTGADGLLGSNLLRELLTRGYTIRAFAQPGRQQKTLEGLNIERVEGDLLNENDVLNAACGCDVVIHCAANTSVWPTRSEVIKRVNIGGTQNIINAVKRNGVKRMIYVGTANSYGFGTKEKPGVEGNEYRSAKYGLDYMDSKYEAQQLILKAVREEGLPALIVNPTFMMGPYDSNPSSGAMIVALYKGKIPGYTVGGRNYVYVKDAATAVANAVTMGRIGECYILGNENLSYKEAFTKMATTIGVKPPSLRIPAWAAVAYGRWGSFLGKMRGKAPAVSKPLARIACDEHYYSAQKAVQELRMPQTPVETGIKECYTWLKDNGYLDN